jgi:hypothetical protein
MSAGPTIMAIALFLATPARGRVIHIGRQLLDIAAALYPETEKFTVLTDDPVRARLYRQIGFKASHLLVWERPQFGGQEL